MASTWWSYNTCWRTWRQWKTLLEQNREIDILEQGAWWAHSSLSPGSRCSWYQPGCGHVPGQLTGWPACRWSASRGSHVTDWTSWLRRSLDSGQRSRPTERSCHLFHQLQIPAYKESVLLLIFWTGNPTFAPVDNFSYDDISDNKENRVRVTIGFLVRGRVMIKIRINH